jgi:hypothetical protein
MKLKDYAADWNSATYQRDAGLASILKNCSTNLSGNLLCDKKGDVC